MTNTNSKECVIKLPRPQPRLVHAAANVMHEGEVWKTRATIWASCGVRSFFWGGEAEWSGGGGFVDEVGVEELGEVDFEVGIVGVI